MTIPALFLPGQLNDDALWQPMLAALPAHFITPCYADYARGNSIEEFARQILSYAPPQFVLVGLSMGGYVALEIMRQSPQRVTALVLFNTSARADDDDKLVERERIMRASQHGRFQGVTNRLLPSIIHPRHMKDRPHLGETIVQMSQRVGQEAFLRQQEAVMARRDARDVLPHIKVPTLIIGGDSDERTPPLYSAEMAALIPGAELHILEQCGHLAPLEEPEVCAGLVERFLTNNL